MSISQNFPEEGPSLNLNFASSKTLDPRITFTRTSSATYTDDNGLIRTASANSPRFDHRYNPTTGEIESLGLLVEEARSNLLLRSEEFDQTWLPTGLLAFGSGSTVNAIVSPDGRATADLVVEDTSTGQHHVRQNNATLGARTFSIFAKLASGSRLLRLVDFNLTDGALGDTYFNLSNGTVASGTGSILAFGNGWYRCSIQSAPTVSSSVYINLASAVGNFSYTGDGTSGIYLWGAQLEAGAFPTSYIPTTSTTATRTADNASMTGTNFSSWYRQGEGTFTVNATSYFPSFQKSAGVSVFNSSAVTSDRISMRMGNTFVQIGGVNQFSNASSNTIPLANNLYKFSIGYKDNDVNTSFNANLFTNDSSATIPTSIDTMTIGNVEGSTTLSINGQVSQITYYPTRLTNSQLQTLTR